jgi:uncharacterized protein YjiS (DUF1127 family)
MTAHSLLTRSDPCMAHEENPKYRRSSNMTLASSSARPSSEPRDETPLFARLAGRFHRYLALRRTRRQLRDLDDYLLNDIGLTRGDLTFVAADSWLERNRKRP